MKHSTAVPDIGRSRRSPLLAALAGTVAVSTMLATSAMAGSHADMLEDAQVSDVRLNDAWLDGKLESSYLLNRHLNSFDIDTKVEDGVVTLQGAVESDIDRNLAAEIAAGIEGVKSVNNELRVKPDSSRKAAAEGEGRTFGEFVDDATTTAVVKSKLLANTNTSGLSVNVDTFRGEVSLSGDVDTDAERELIEQIVRNVDYVATVKNEIRVGG